MSPASAHATDRAAERYGLTPSAADWAGVVVDVTDTLLGIRIGAVRREPRKNGLSPNYLVGEQIAP